METYLCLRQVLEHAYMQQIMMTYKQKALQRMRGTPEAYRRSSHSMGNVITDIHSFDIHTGVFQVYLDK